MGWGGGGEKITEKTDTRTKTRGKEEREEKRRLVHAVVVTGCTYCILYTWHVVHAILTV